MSDKIIFKGEDQSLMVLEANKIVSSIENSLPRVPWFSNTGQQNAFKNILSIITNEVNNLNADPDSKNAIIF